MEKLIELLDEYDCVQYHKINHKIENGNIYRNVGGTDGWYQIGRYSKKFGFIDWLVKNDKIDFEKFPQVMEYSDYESLLMLLSIQDNPIEYLCSILK